MIVDLDRAVRRVEPDGQWSDPAPLSTYRYAPAYVLLGDPGAGKSIAFKRECRETQEAELVTARDFRTIYDTRRPPSVETLLIDGLDEARAGGGDPRGPFDDIRARVRELAPRRVRLSCRELDWLGENDQSNLSKVAPGEELFVLRLEPLSRDEQRRIVEARSGIPDVDAFLTEAAERGVGGLLANPQTLVLLVQTVGETGEFPKGRTETFERACLILAREPNDDHRIAAPLPPPGTLLDAAGHMCAVSLLSGSAGFALPDASEADGFVPISVVGNNSDTAIRASGTRLFAGVGNRSFMPVHANLAAFLGARYLAELVSGAVPHGRILALLAGHDGAPPTPLRSLVAWLAALSPELRRSLITRDPVAVLMYGDVRRFSPDHKSLLLDEVGAERTRLSGSFWPRSALEALATPDMEEPLRTLLRDPDRSARRQMTLAVATAALREAHPIPGVATDLLTVAKDADRRSDVRAAALGAWIRAVEADPNRDRHLLGLLEDVRSGALADPDDELRGTLLDAAYPTILSPARLWGFFGRNRPQFFGRTFVFWASLSEKARREDFPDLLDQLADRLPSLSAQGDTLLGQVSLRVLLAGLQHHGNDRSPARVLRWLRIGESRMQWQSPVERDPAEQIRAWLEANPETVKALAAAAHDGARDHPYPFHEIQRLLFGARLPEGMGQAIPELQPEDHPQQEAERILKARTYWQEKHEEEMREYRQHRAREDAKGIAVLRNHEAELLANRAPHPLLHHLAFLYFRRDPLMVSGPDSRNLEEVLGGDRHLIHVALTGIRGAPERTDLPSPGDILRLKKDGKQPWLTAAVLAGLDIRSSESEYIRLTDSQWRTALACRHVFYGPSQDAAWYATLVQDRPDLVSETLISFGRARLREGEESLPDFWHLPRDQTFSEVAQRVTGPLLRAFPVRAKAAQHGSLRELLWSGLIHLEPEVFREIIETKLRASSMTKAQRAHWLAAGFALDPFAFQPRLTRVVEGSEHRVKPLAEFFAPVSGLGSANQIPILTRRLAPSAMGFLIETLAAVFPPVHEAGFVTIRGETVHTVQRLIDQLARSPEPGATQALEKLLSVPSLEKWLPQLEWARDTQRVVRRDAGYREPIATEVIAVLSNGPAANASDLRALVLDRLARIDEEVRTTNANLWRQFWTEDKQRNTPKDENACRDALLPLLQHRLPEGCDAQPEGQYAKNRRADIRIASGAWNIPIEIKKNRHSDIWRTVRNQLLPRYTNDPATEGLGIYLVLWFGPQHTAPGPEGRRPQTPDELRDQLLDSLTPQERRRAAVLVMDVTPPPPAKAVVSMGLVGGKSASVHRRNPDGRSPDLLT